MKKRLSADLNSNNNKTISEALKLNSSNYNCNLGDIKRKLFNNNKIIGQNQESVSPEKINVKSSNVIIKMNDDNIIKPNKRKKTRELVDKIIYKSVYINNFKYICINKIVEISKYKDNEINNNFCY